VCCIDKDLKFLYVREEENECLLEIITSQLQNLPRTAVTAFDIKEGNLFAVEVRGMLHRARVLDPSSCTVLLLETGLTLQVKQEDLFFLPCRFAKIKPMARKVCTQSLKPNEPNKSKIVHAVTGGEHIIMTRIQPADNNNVQLCDLIVAGKSIHSFLADEEASETMQYKKQSLEIGTWHKVLVSKIEFLQRPWLIYFNLEEDVKQIRKISNAIEEFTRTAPSIKDASAILPKRAVLAFSINDSLWYRAEVVKMDENVAKVYFVDVGGHEDVPVKNLRLPSKEFVDFSAFAFPCVMDGLGHTLAAGIYMQSRCIKEVLKNNFFLIYYSIIYYFILALHPNGRM